MDRIIIIKSQPNQEILIPGKYKCFSYNKLLIAKLLHQTLCDILK